MASHDLSTSTSRTANDLKQLSRLLFVLTLALVCVVSVAGVWTFFFDVQTRLLVLILGSVPPALFVLAHALLEFNQPFRVVRRPILILSLLSLCLLYMPTFFVLSRHILLPVDWVNAATLIALVLFALLLAPALKPIADVIPDPTGLLPLVARLAEHLRAVMWDFRLEGTDVLDHEHLPRKRVSALTDQKALRIFQSTLTTPERDAAAACSLLHSLPSEIAVLDVGGGDGAFTRFLTSGLSARGKRVLSITVVDPVDWASEYQGQFRNLQSLPQLTFRRQRFADYDTTDRFDLVIASHSLYGECNVAPSERLERLRQVLFRLLAYRKNPGGVAIVALASGLGKSYQFKRYALARVFGEPLNDLVAEDLDGLFATIDVPNESRTVDNLIKLEEALTEAAAGSQGKLADWLEYFLRIPSLDKSVPPNVWADLVEMLVNHTEAFASLPESERGGYEQMASIALSREDRVLPHKTRIWALET